MTTNASDPFLRSTPAAPDATAQPMPPARPTASPRRSGFLWFLPGLVVGFVVGILTASIVFSAAEYGWHEQREPRQPLASAIPNECAEARAVEDALNAAIQKQPMLVDPQVTNSGECTGVTLTAGLSGAPTAEDVAALHEAFLTEAGQAISELGRGGVTVKLNWMVGGTKVTTDASLNNDTPALLRTTLAAGLDVAKLGPQSVLVKPNSFNPNIEVSWRSVSSSQLAMIHPDPATNPNGAALHYRQVATVGDLGVQIAQNAGAQAIDDAELRRWVDEAVRTKASSLNVNATAAGVSRIFGYADAKDGAALEPKAVDLLRSLDQCTPGTFTEVDGLGDRGEPKVRIRYDCKGGKFAVAPMPVTPMERKMTDNDAAQRALDAVRK